MKTKKAAAEWYIAFTNYLTFGVINGLVFVVLLFLVAFINLNPNIFILLMYLIFPFTTWLGVQYSANYIHKTYIINNKAKVVNLSAIYSIIIALIFICFSAFNNKMELNTKIFSIAFGVAYSALIIWIFYSASKKYIKNSSEL